MSETTAGLLQVALLIAALAACYRPLGAYMARVYTSEHDIRIERVLYRVMGVDPKADQRWPVYARSLLAFSAVSLLFPAAEALPTVQTPDFVLDFANYRATRGEQEVRLTPTEWRLLSALAATPGHLVTHAQLLRAAWGPSYGRESNYLRVYANQLRRKLEPDPGHPRYLLTEPGIGYRLMV